MELGRTRLSNMAASMHWSHLLEILVDQWAVNRVCARGAR
jgi:hypothetical protein